MFQWLFETKNLTGPASLEMQIGFFARDEEKDNSYPFYFGFSSSREGGTYSIYWKKADGTGATEKLGSMENQSLLPLCWSGDGKTLITSVTEDMTTKWDIGILSMEENHSYELLLQTEWTEIQGQISPDGKYLAYASNESGQIEVYIRPFPDVNGGKWQASTSGAARWP